MSASSMKWRYLGHLRLLSKAVAVRAEVEINSQEEMANPQGMKLFAVERHGLPEDFLYCPAIVWSAIIVATRICAELANRLGSAT